MKHTTTTKKSFVKKHKTVLIVGAVTAVAITAVVVNRRFERELRNEALGFITSKGLGNEFLTSIIPV